MCLGVGEVVETKQFLEGCGAFAGFGQRQMVQVELRDETPLHAAAERGALWLCWTEKAAKRSAGGGEFGVERYLFPLSGQAVGEIAIGTGRPDEDDPVGGQVWGGVEIDKVEEDVGAVVAGS